MYGKHVKEHLQPLILIVRIFDCKCKGTTFHKRFQMLMGYEWGYHAQSLTVSAENTVSFVTIVSIVIIDTIVSTVVAFIAAFI